MSPIYVNTEERLTHEDVAQYLQRCQRPEMAVAVRQWHEEFCDLRRRYHDLLLEVARLRNEIQPRSLPGERASYKSEWE